MDFNAEVKQPAIAGFLARLPAEAVSTDRSGLVRLAAEMLAQEPAAPIRSGNAADAALSNSWDEI